MAANKMLKLVLKMRMSEETRRFFVVQGETERGCLRSKLSGCPKMRVGMLLESCGGNETAWPKLEGGDMWYKSSSVESWQAPQELQLRDQWLSACHGSVSGS